MKRKTIIALVGDSGSGKTTASIWMESFSSFKDFKTIVSYTTRPMRPGEINGVEHWFVNKEDVPPQNKMCAYTEFGGYQYWTEWEQFRDGRHAFHVYVIDEKGLMDLMDKKNAPFDFGLILVKIKRDVRAGIDKERVERDLDRITLGDDFYDYVIENNCGFDEFKLKIFDLCKTIKEKGYGSTK